MSLWMFILDITWDEHQNEMLELEKITNKILLILNNANYSDNNYVVVYKRNGEDTSIPKVEKPVITPVSVNRDDQTDFLINLSEEKVKDIEPVFLNFEEDIKISSVGDVELLYKENIENERFRLNYVIDIGTNHDNRQNSLQITLNF